MAGYNGRDGLPAGDSYINATAFNSQIGDQRTALEARQGESDLGNARDNIGTLFSGFDAAEIMKKAKEKFLKKVNADDNPDFRADFKQTFKAYNVLVPDEITPDGAKLRVGPTLATQKIDDALNGVLDSGDNREFQGGQNERDRGFGWYDTQYKSNTLGGYFVNRYKFEDNQDLGLEALRGERADSDRVDYEG